MSAVAAPADRRFRRAHVKPARTRRRGPGRVKLFRYVAAGLFVLYGVYLGVHGIGQTALLRIDRIVVRGNQRLSAGQVLAVLSGLRGENLISTDLGYWRARLMASPWVSAAELRRQLPSTVEVTIRERQPIGIGRLRDSMYLVDEGGAIVDEYGPQYSDLDLPIIDGLATGGEAGGAAIDAARADLAARVIATLKSSPDAARRLSQVDVGDLHNAQVILDDDPAVISLGEAQFLERLENYLQLAPALRERVAKIDHVDVRFDNRIYVRPGPQPARGDRK